MVSSVFFLILMSLIIIITSANQSDINGKSILFILRIIDNRRLFRYNIYYTFNIYINKFKIYIYI